MTILFFLVKAPFEHVSQRKRAFTIMAKRTTTAHDDTRSLVDYLERPKLELILPMMLQFLKAMIIHGSTITTVMAAMYWIDWAMVQYCHCWVYFRPITNEESTCENTIHHGFKGDPICERGWGLQEEAANSIDVFASPEANDGLRWPLELCIIFTVGGFFLEPLFGGSADSAEMFVILLAAYTGIGSFVIFVWFDRLEVKYHLEGIGFALFTAYTVLFEFSLILIYYKFAYQEAGTYKPGWLDWLG
jgi:hypothetical protein